MAVYIEDLTPGLTFQTTVTRARFEYLCHDLFAKCLAPVKAALLQATLGKSKIHTIVFSGALTLTVEPAGV